MRAEIFMLHNKLKDFYFFATRTKIKKRKGHFIKKASYRHSHRTTWFDPALISQLVSFLYGIFFPVLNSCTSPSFFFTVLFPHPSFLQHLLSRISLPFVSYKMGRKTARWRHSP